jgi:LacI family transcriptional regulator, galactose operon repressor
MPSRNLMSVQRLAKRSVTINDVAALAGVSIATVSRVINGTSRVSPTMQYKVQSAISILNFVPHTAARILATKMTNTIGLILPEISGFYFSPLLHGIEECIRENGFDLLVHSSVSRPDMTDEPTKKLGEHNTDGLLVYTASISKDEINRLHGHGFPMVLLLQSPPGGMDIPSVNIENKSGAEKVINHLLTVHGHQKIAFLAGPDNEEDSFWREQGYREALANHGIPIDPGLISIGGFDTLVAQKSVTEWLAKGIQFDAIFAGDDDSAIGAITALQNAGLRVPEDIAVVGFDDVYVSQYLTPPLTTVHVPIERAGYVAAQQLINLIHQEIVNPKVLLPTELIIRRSCGCQR